MQKKNIILLIISSLVLTPLQSQATFDLIKGLGIVGSTLGSIVLLNSINREKNPLDDEIDEKSKEIEEKTKNFEEYKKSHTELRKLQSEKELNQKHIEKIKNTISKLKKNKKNIINSILRYGSTLGAITSIAIVYILINKYINPNISPEDHHLKIMKVRAEIASLEKAYSIAKGTAKEYNVNVELSKKKALLQSLENQQISPNKGMPSIKSILGLVATIATSGIATWKLAHILFPHYTPTKEETLRIKDHGASIKTIQNNNETLTKEIEKKDIEVTLLKEKYPGETNKTLQEKVTKLTEEKKVLEIQQTHILGKNQSTNNPLGGLVDLIKSISLYA